VRVASNPGDLLLDPFAGSGSTLAVAARSKGPARPAAAAPPNLRRLARIGEAVRDEVRARYNGPDCCILATAALLDVLRHFRLTARPPSVNAGVFNPAMTERTAREGLPATREELERDWFPAGCKSVGVGSGGAEAGGRWTGHLVAAVAGRVVMDLALGQAGSCWRPPSGGRVDKAACQQTQYRQEEARDGHRR
jgi:hypothetical protein